MIPKSFIISLFTLLLLAGAAFAAVPTVIYPWGDGTWFDPIMTTDNHNGSWVAVNEPFTHCIRMFHVDSAGAVQCSLAYHGTTEIEPQHIETDSAGGFFLQYLEIYYVFVEPEIREINRLQMRHYAASGEFGWQTLVADTNYLDVVGSPSVTMLDTTLLVCWHWARSDSNGLYCQRINTLSGNPIGDRIWLGTPCGPIVTVVGTNFFLAYCDKRCILTPGGDLTCTLDEQMGPMNAVALGDTVFIAGIGLGARLIVERYFGTTQLSFDSISQLDLPIETNLVRLQQGVRTSWSYIGKIFTRQWSSNTGWDTTQQICQDTMAYKHHMVATDSGATFVWYYWHHRDHLFAQRINDRHIFWQPDGLSLWPLGGAGFDLCSSGPCGIAAWIGPNFGLCVAPVDSLSDTPVGDKPGLNPSTFRISIFPNPFNQETTIALEIPWSEQPVDLQIYNTLGQRVIATELVPEGGKARYHFKGNNLTSGIYFAKATANHHIEVKKLLLLK